MPKKRYNDEDDEWNRDFFEDMFGNFDDEFRRMNEKIMRFFNSMRKNPDQNVEGPFIYGFNFRQGPDGKPSFQEFGNVPEMMHRPPGKALEQDVREPMTDLNEDQDNVYLTYELPGISKENIDLNVGDDTVTLNVKEGPRKYHKEVHFNYKLKTESTKAKFVNGILDVSVAKEVKSQPSGRRVNIE